jgi:hypothetical protein
MFRGTLEQGQFVTPVLDKTWSSCNRLICWSFSFTPLPRLGQSARSVTYPGGFLPGVQIEKDTTFLGVSFGVS